MPQNSAESQIPQNSAESQMPQNSVESQLARGGSRLLGGRMVVAHLIEELLGWASLAAGG